MRKSKSKSGWVILLLSNLLFSCQKEISEKEKVEQFVTEYINFAIDNSDSRSEEITEKFYAVVHAK